MEKGGLPHQKFSVIVADATFGFMIEAVPPTTGSVFGLVKLFTTGPTETAPPENCVPVLWVMNCSIAAWSWLVLIFGWKVPMSSFLPSYWLMVKNFWSAASAMTWSRVSA